MDESDPLSDCHLNVVFSVVDYALNTKEVSAKCEINFESWIKTLEL